MTVIQKVSTFCAKHAVMMTLLFAMIVGALCFVGGMEYQKRTSFRNFPPMMQRGDFGRGNGRFDSRNQGSFKGRMGGFNNQNQQPAPQQPEASPAAQLK